VLPHCDSEKIAVVGYTPFGQKCTPEASTKSGAVLHKVALEHEATPEEIILAFLVRRLGDQTESRGAIPSHTEPYVSIVLFRQT
jgi:diketogulonate reductase-like aldo/keto reductase